MMTTTTTTTLPQEKLARHRSPDHRTNATAPTLVVLAAADVKAAKLASWLADAAGRSKMQETFTDDVFVPLLPFVESASRGRHPERILLRVLQAMKATEGEGGGGAGAAGDASSEAYITPARFVESLAAKEADYPRFT